MRLDDDFPRFPWDSAEAVVEWIGLPLPELREVGRSAEVSYRQGWVPKRGGGWRRINKPVGKLKTVQQRLAPVLGGLIASPIAYGIGKGGTHTDAARVHERKAWVAIRDIQDFFGSVSDRHVQVLLAKMGCRPEVVQLVVPLVTLRGKLPQGAHTSPAIANLLLTGVDQRLYRAAWELGVAISRYSDDFAMSSADKGAVLQVAALVERELQALGLQVNRRKSRLRPRPRRQVVHGLTVNNGASIPKRRAPRSRSEGRPKPAGTRRSQSATPSAGSRATGLPRKS